MLIASSVVRSTMLVKTSGFLMSGLAELRKIASEAVKERQLRWRILDYLAFWDPDFDGFEMLELVEATESCPSRSMTFPVSSFME
jgi:hypothetical protein